MKALSIMQPWAWLIVSGYKDIENRDWPTRFRGPVLIHAGKRVDREAASDLTNGIHPVTGEPIEFDVPGSFPTGGIVGRAEIIGCVADSDSPWFVGRYGFLIRNAIATPLRPCKGALGFFSPTDITPAGRAAIEQEGGR